MEEEDISQERSHREGGWKKEKEPQEKERGPWDARGVGDSSPRARVPFFLGPLGRLILYVFPTSEQAVALSEPNFRTHFLQIHCNGLGLKTVTLQFQKHIIFEL